MGGAQCHLDRPDPARREGQRLVRGDPAGRAEPIEIGFGTNIQDGVTVLVDPGYPVSSGSGVSVGHNAVLHGCVIEDDTLIGMGAAILNGAVIGSESLGCVGAARRCRPATPVSHRGTRAGAAQTHRGRNRRQPPQRRGLPADVGHTSGSDAVAWPRSQLRRDRNLTLRPTLDQCPG